MDWRVKRIVRWTEEHCGQQNLSLRLIAGQCQLSPRHLGRLFRGNLGVGFHTYLRAVRMKRASELLLKTSKSVKEIAVEAGYSRPSNFDRDFRRTYGTRPKDYRLMQSALFKEEEISAAQQAVEATAGD